MRGLIFKLTLKKIREVLPIILLFLFFFWLFFNLLSSRMLFPGEKGLYSGGSTWGDLAFHLSLISSFVWGGNSPSSPFNPTYFGEKLTYPFIPDLISAYLIKMGMSLRWSLIVPSLIFLLILVFLIYFLTLKITKSKIGAILTPFIFFFNGSILGTYYFWQDFKESGLSFFSFLGNLQKQYAHLEKYNLHFSNIICDYLLPQRAIIFGLVLGVISLYFLWKYFEGKEKKDLLKTGLIVGFLPLIHTHTFLAIVLVAGFLGLIELFSNLKNFKKIIFDWLYFLIPIILIALPQIFWLGILEKKGFWHFQIGWMKSEENIFLFWFKNLGLYLVLIILAFIFAKNELKIFYLPFLGLFLISNLIIFQPDDYDNMKIMLFWFLLSCLLIANLFQQILNRFSLKGLFIIIPIFLLLIVTGVLSVYRESYTKWLMFSNEDIKVAEFIKENTPKDSIFLTSDKHNHLVPCLAGRKILMGYRGWLWTHGIDYRQREKDVLTMFSGKIGAKNLIENYGIDYVFIGHSERKNFNANDLFFNQNYSLVFNSEDIKIYKVK